MKTLLIGNKNYNFINLNKLIDLFENNVRFNLAIHNNNNGTKCDIIMLNNHVHSSLNKSLNDNIKHYNNSYSLTTDYIKNFYKNIKLYKNIKCQYYQNSNIVNKFLNKINCKYQFTHLPRVGYQYLMNEVMNRNIPYIIGFSIEGYNSDKHIYKLIKGQNSKYHNETSEIKIFIWLHNNNYIDATLCMISNDNENIKTLLLDCSILYPKIESLILILQSYNECYLKNYDVNIIQDIINDNKNIVLDGNRLYLVNF